jgi:hypothetical protein
MKHWTRLALGLAVGAGVAMVAAPKLLAQTTAVAEKERIKNVSGTVLDKSETPLSGAVVYLKNTKTLAVKSVYSSDAGEFHFNALSPNTDYQIYAEFNGVRSGTKTVSSFDNRTSVNMTLKVDVAK